MTLLRESCLWHLCCVLASLCKESALYRIFDRMGSWCCSQIDESRFFCFFFKEGAVARSWPDSCLCRLLTWIVNLPGELLHKLYKALQLTFEDSFFARLAFSMGEQTAIAASWLIMLLWIIPYSRWNNAYTLLGFAALLVLFHAGAMRSRKFRLDLAGIGFYPLILLGAIFLGVLLSYAPSLSLRFLLYHLSAALCVLVTVSSVRSEGDLKRLAAGGAVCVVVSGGYGIVQRIQGVAVNASYVDLSLNEGMPGRVYSFYDNPNTFAEVMMLLLPLVLALVICSRHWIGKAIACGIFAVGAVALAMTYSRASWVGFAVAIVMLVVFWKPKIIPVFAVVCIAALPLLPQTVWNRILTITNMNDSSTASRFPLYEAAMDVIKNRPLSGAGLGTAAVQSYIRDYRLYDEVGKFVHSHNFYLQVWIETGLLGIIGFVSAMLWNIKRTAGMAHRCSSSAARTIACAAAGSMCGAMVCGLADYLWNYPRVMCIFWFVFAVALAGTKVCLAENSLDFAE